MQMISFVSIDNRGFHDRLENNNSTLEHVLQWASYNSLSAVASKSKVIMFGSMNFVAPDLNVFVANNRLKNVDNIKCLSVILVSTFNFKSHIDNVSCRVCGALRWIY